MPAGKPFTERQSSEIDRAVRNAHQETGLRFSIWVGQAPQETRRYARRLHAALGRDAPTSVLIAVDPVARRLEIVTGRAARRRVDDRTCALAAMSMTSAFSTGDLTGGITSGVSMLADHGRQQSLPHENSPE